MGCDIKFSVLVDMLEAISRNRKPNIKKKHLKTFLDHVCSERDYFSAIRLILPELDKERASSGLKETALAKLLTESLGLSKNSSDAKKILEWRKGGKKSGSYAGNFSMVAIEVLASRQRQQSSGITISEVNNFLDNLSDGDEKKNKTSIMSQLLAKTNVREMKWIIMIILKELKLGMSEKTVFSVFHPDATELFNVTCDLRLVCEKLVNRNERHQRKDIEPGHAVRPQLASRVASAQVAFKQMKGKSMVVETKFDGDRIQIHKDGNEIHFFSRNFIDHSEFKASMSDILRKNILPERCILDGEMSVWDKTSNQFVEFGSNQTFARSTGEGPHYTGELCYICFDILFANDSSLIHRPLRERKAILTASVKPVKGRLEVLNPDTDPEPDYPTWTKYVQSAAEIQQFFVDTVENREEGIVVKDLDSKWVPGDRSQNWLKLKPDYVSTESDLDVIVMGGYYGSGRNGGEIAQFLLGVSERPIAGQNPKRFLSFCKVGTGLSDKEMEHLRSKLSPFFTKIRPECYTVTNHSKERPDLWVSSPEKSVLLEIRSDIRTIHSQVFASAYSLRFPRAVRVRYDKPWYDCLDEESLVKMVAESGVNYGEAEQKAPRKKPADLPPMVPCHLAATDVSHLQQKSHIFTGLTFYIVSLPAEWGRSKAHETVAENGGQLSMNLTLAVTHCIAADKKGFRFMTACQHGDVVRFDWLEDCVRRQELLPIKPKYFLHASAATKERLRSEVDAYGDAYFADVDAAELRGLFEDMAAPNLGPPNLSPRDQAALQRSPFGQVKIAIALDPSFPDLAMAAHRLSISFEMNGGQIVDDLRGPTAVTHLVVATLSPNSVPASCLPLQSVREGMALQGAKFVSHSWLEKLLETGSLAAEEGFSVRVLDGSEPKLGSFEAKSERFLPRKGTSLQEAAGIGGSSQSMAEAAAKESEPAERMYQKLGEEIPESDKTESKPRSRDAAMEFPNPAGPVKVEDKLIDSMIDDFFPAVKPRSQSSRAKRDNGAMAASSASPADGNLKPKKKKMSYKGLVDSLLGDL